MNCLKILLLIAVCQISVSGRKIRRRKHPNMDYHKSITLNISVIYDRLASYKALKQLHLKKLAELTKVTEKLLYDTQELFHSKFFGVRIKLNHLRTKILHTRSYQNADAPDYLRKYCTWQSRIKERKNVHFFSVLLTGVNIFWSGRAEPYATKALTYRNSFCNTSKSCSVIEWHEKNLAYTLAHELGHSLGMRHDKNKTGCNSTTSLMTPRFRNSRHFLDYKWTKCNAKDLRAFLTSPEGSCLRR